MVAMQAGMASEDHPERLMIALEPEAASIYVRKLRLYQLVPDNPATQTLPRGSSAHRHSHYSPDSPAAGTTADVVGQRITTNDTRSLSVNRIPLQCYKLFCVKTGH